MTQNYYLEYRFIPNLLHEVRSGRNPLQSLIDSRWIKETLTNNNVDIDWDGFSIDVYDEEYSKTSLDKGKYIAYTFPSIISVPEAKYGVIDIDTMKYYTLESDYSDGYWAIGSQNVNGHSLIEMIQGEMSLEEFMKSLNRPQTPPINRSHKGCLSVIVLIIVVVWGIVGLYGCGAGISNGGSLVPDEDTGDKIETIEFCGVTFGVNVQWIGSDDNKVPKSITLLTSHQDKKSFEAIKEGISKYLGNPNNEEYEVGDDHRVYGRVEWNKGFSVTLRNIHSDEGGLIIFIM